MISIIKYHKIFYIDPDDMDSEEPPSDGTNDSSEQVISQLALAEMFACVCV